MIKPLKDNVVIRAFGADETTQGGIILAGNVIPPVLEKGEIVAIGPAPECEELKAGDKVFFHRFAGKDSKVIEDGTEYRVASVKDVYAVIED